MSDVSGYPWAPHARMMGELRKGEIHWDVYLESLKDADGGLVRGRVHFVAGDRHRESAWIFVELTDREIVERFNEFSDVELWSLMESLGP
jgi:hypothetical protein